MFSKPYKYDCLLNVPHKYYTYHVRLVLRKVNAKDNFIKTRMNLRPVVTSYREMFKEGGKCFIKTRFYFNACSFMNRNASFCLDVYLIKENESVQCYSSSSFKIYARRNEGNYDMLNINNGYSTGYITNKDYQEPTYDQNCAKITTLRSGQCYVFK